MEILSLLGMLTIFPAAATVVGAVMLLVFARTKIRTGMVTGVLWLLYSVYEFLMYFRILCSGECNIRVDLLLIYPVLIGMTVLSVVLLIVARLRRGDPVD